MELSEAMALAKERPDEIHALVLAWNIELRDEWIWWAEQEIARLRDKLEHEKARS